jgi:hypothetical protein
MTGGVSRIVALGASNLTRGFHTVVAASRNAWGHDVEILAALGHGRSYGAPSAVLGRRLPGILECGLWRELASLAAAPTRALVTDVGNDILYGFSAERIVAWVEDALARLERVTRDVVVMGLPLASIRRLSRVRYLLFRSLLVPSCRLSLPRVLETAEQVDDRLATLTAGRGLRFVSPEADWYGFDPVHVRPSRWWGAWTRILGTPGEVARGSSLREGLQLYLMRPEKRWLLGVEQRTPQSGAPLLRGGRIWLY